MPLGANKAAIMGVAGVSTGDVVLLQTQTADNDATVSFTSGINATYGEYVFKFYNINAATDQAGPLGAAWAAMKGTGGGAIDNLMDSLTAAGVGDSLKAAGTFGVGKVIGQGAQQRATCRSHPGDRDTVLHDAENQAAR